MAGTKKHRKSSNGYVDTKKKTSKCLIYFIHDLHGLIDGVLHEPDFALRNPPPTPIRFGGITGILASLQALIPHHKRVEKIDQAFVCLGGDMVAEFRSRMLSADNVEKVWRYILRSLEPHAWVLGNHELDPEYARRLHTMISHESQTGCTRNLTCTCCSVTESASAQKCLHHDQTIPAWSAHTTSPLLFDTEPKIVFTGLTEPKAGWTMQGYRNGIGEDFDFQTDDVCRNDGWTRVCQDLMEGWNQPNDNVHKLIRQFMPPNLDNAVSRYIENGLAVLGTENEFPKCSQLSMIECFNRIVHMKAFYSEHVEILLPITVLKQFPKDAKLFSLKTSGTLSSDEEAFLNRSLLRFAFSPPLACKSRYLFHASDPRKCIELLKAEPVTCHPKGTTVQTGCPRLKNSSVHIHIAHFEDMSPEVFGSRQGPWLESGPGYGLPVVILKAHDHACTQATEGAVERFPTKKPAFPEFIPTFEAGCNGLTIGKLALEIDDKNIHYKWEVFPTRKAKAFTSLDLQEMGGVGHMRPQSYPILARNISFAKMGGSPSNPNELYRAVSLFLRSVSHYHTGLDRGPATVIACPSFIISDSYIDYSANRGTIDLFDVGHLFGHREIMYTVKDTKPPDLVAAILTGLGRDQLRMSILPPEKGERQGGRKLTYQKVPSAWRYAPHKMPLNVSIGRVICLHHKTITYLIVSSKFLEHHKDVEKEGLEVYELIQSGDECTPRFHLRLDARNIDSLAASLLDVPPSCIYIDGFLAKRFGWRQRLKNADRITHVNLVADYIKHCDSFKRGLWQ